MKIILKTHCTGKFDTPQTAELQLIAETANDQEQLEALGYFGGSGYHHLTVKKSGSTQITFTITRGMNS